MLTDKPSGGFFPDICVCTGPESEVESQGGSGSVPGRRRQQWASRLPDIQRCGSVDQRKTGLDPSRHVLRVRSKHTEPDGESGLSESHPGGRSRGFSYVGSKQRLSISTTRRGRCSIPSAHITRRRSLWRCDRRLRDYFRFRVAAQTRQVERRPVETAAEMGTIRPCHVGYTRHHQHGHSKENQD
jgi:hypothetical protein